MTRLRIYNPGEEREPSTLDGAALPPRRSTLLGWAHGFAVDAVVIALVVLLTAIAGRAPAQQLLFFTAASCGPCQDLAPRVEELEAEGFAVQTVDVAAQPDFAQAHGVERVPTVVALDAAGREVDRAVGSVDRIRLAHLAVRAGKPQGVVPYDAIARVVVGSGLGSGTLVAPDVVVTNWHLFRDETTGRATIDLPEGRFGGSLVARDELNDLAAVRLDRAARARPVSIGVGAEPPAGELVAVGYGGLEGRLAEFRGRPAGWVQPTTPNNPHRALVLEGVKTRSGDSGGPVFDTRYRFVGVVWGNDGACYVCVGQPLRRFLDQLLPGRPGAVIPHAQWTGPYRLAAPPAAVPPANVPVRPVPGDSGATGASPSLPASGPATFQDPPALDPRPSTLDPPAVPPRNETYTPPATRPDPGWLRQAGRWAIDNAGPLVATALGIPTGLGVAGIGLWAVRAVARRLRRKNTNGAADNGSRPATASGGTTSSDAAPRPGGTGGPPDAGRFRGHAVLQRGGRSAGAIEADSTQPVAHDHELRAVPRHAVRSG